MPRDTDMFQIITTESCPYADARGSDFLITYNRDFNIRIDPTKSYYERLIKERKHGKAEKEFERQLKLMDKVDLIIITHFHSDHVSGLEFLKYVDNLPISLYNKNTRNSYKNILLEYTDPSAIEGITLNVPNIQIRDIKDTGVYAEFMMFDHGRYKGLNLGKVIVSYFENNSSIIISSDLSGPEFDKPTEYIINKDPDFLILDGPFNYLKNVNPFRRKDPNKAKRYRKKIQKEIEKSYYNLYRIIKKTGNLKRILLIHHFHRNFEIEKLLEYEKYLVLMDIADSYGVSIIHPFQIKKGLIRF